MRAAFLDQPYIQVSRFGRTDFQSKNKSMGQVKAGGIQIAACFALIRRLRIELHQRRLVSLAVGSQQELIQCGVTHGVVRRSAT